MNISSVIVIPKPDGVDRLVSTLRDQPGVEVALVSPEGKIIITIETTGDRETIEAYERISLMEGVLSASMVYHHQETDPEASISVEA